MEYLQTLLDNSEIPVVTAFLLGLLTAVSPCPLATNITAIGFIGKNIDNRNAMFANGLLYTLGRVIAYAALGGVLIAVLRAGADVFAIQDAVSRWGEVLIGPALVLIGLFMLFGNRLPLPKFGFSAGAKTERLRGAWGSVLLGMLFAMILEKTGSLGSCLLLHMGANTASLITSEFASVPDLDRVMPFLSGYLLLLMISAVGGCWYFFGKRQRAG